MTRKRKAGDLGDVEFAVLAQSARNDWQRFYKVPLLNPVIDSALELTKNHALRGADAIHLASAVLLSAYLAEQRNDLVFVGSDQELNKAAARVGLSVIDPREKL